MISRENNPGAYLNLGIWDERRNDERAVPTCFAGSDGVCISFEVLENYLCDGVFDNPNQEQHGTRSDGMADMK
jgi:hypothetical protein